MRTPSTHSRLFTSARLVLAAGILAVIPSLVPGVHLAAAHPAYGSALSPAHSSTANHRHPTATVSPAPSATLTPSPSATPVSPTATSLPATATSVPTTVTSAPSSPMSALVAGLKVMNYYPAGNSWANMWTNWDPTAINSDFGRIAALHANAVRIIIQASTFGYPVPSPTMQDHLAQIISLAQNNGLKVQLTLFDWWNGYTDLAGSRQWAGAVLSPLAGNSDLAFIELQNEIDPTNAAAMSWAQQMIPYLRTVDGGLPVTVSVYGANNLQLLSNSLRSTPPDFYDYHYYGSPEAAYSDFQHAQQVVAPLPLFIGEVGFSSAISNTSVGGLPDTTPALEAYQDFFYRSVEHTAQSLGLPQVAPWVLSDFVPGSLTWVSTVSAEYDFGLYHTDGTAKPIAASVAAAFASGLVDTSFNNSFENCTAGTPADWLLFHAGEGRFACDTAVAHTGTSSARISASTGDSAGVPAFFLSPTDAHVVPGQVYTASAWVKGANLSGTTQIALAWFGAGGSYLGTTSSVPLPTGTTDWTQLTASGSAPVSAEYVEIHCKSAYNTGTAWFDDVTYQ